MARLKTERDEIAEKLLEYADGLENKDKVESLTRKLKKEFDETCIDLKNFQESVNFFLLKKIAELLIKVEALEKENNKFKQY